jgi:uncharacterized protein
VRRSRTVTDALPSELALHDGIAYSLWLPATGQPARGGVLILHGAGSRKESHHDFARVVCGAGLAALAFDQRGHGASPGPLNGRVLEDTVARAKLLREKLGDLEAPLALRGSSMGGYLAIVASAPAAASAVVAICPAGANGLRRALKRRGLRFDVDAPALDALLAAHDLPAAIATLEPPLLLLHAEGDEQVPVQQSRELARHFVHPRSRLITLAGGHHRSIQHDPELQAVSLRFIEQAFGARPADVHRSLQDP